MGSQNHQEKRYNLATIREPTFAWWMREPWIIYKEVNRRNVEDLQNFPNVWVTTVIRKGRGLEGAMKMLGEANEALGPIAIIKDDSFM